MLIAMTTEQFATIVGALVLLIGAIGKFIIDMHNLKTKIDTASKVATKDKAEVKGQLDTVSTAVKEIERQTNSMTSALASSKFAEGLLTGADQERKEQAKQEGIKAIEEMKGSADDPIHVKLTDEELPQKPS